jgi:hypothetical protein
MRGPFPGAAFLFVGKAAGGQSPRAARRAADLVEGLLDKGQMRLDRGAGGGGVAGLDAVVDRLVLVQQLVAGHAVAEHDLAVVEHALPQQVVHRPHHVQHDDVVAGLDDRQVELRVQVGLVGGSRFWWAAFHLA